MKNVRKILVIGIIAALVLALASFVTAAIILNDTICFGGNGTNPDTDSEKTITNYKWYSGALRHKVIYSDGTYDMEDCAEHDCVCGRQYN